VTSRKCEVQKFTSRFVLQSRVQGTSIGNAFKRDDTCANTCDLHVGYSVQIMRFAIVHKIFIGVCNLCGKYFSLMDF
jgi:hypothetical protein